MELKLNKTTELMITSRRNKDKSAIATKFQGSYIDYMGMMMEKHKQYGCKIQDSDDVIVINSADGPEYLKSKNKMLRKEEMCLLLPALEDVLANKQ
eukprot:8998299-Ditylum_brightwellii.AAC.1